MEETKEQEEQTITDIAGFSKCIAYFWGTTIVSATAVCVVFLFIMYGVRKWVETFTWVSLN